MAVRCSCYGQLDRSSLCRSAVVVPQERDQDDDGSERDDRLDEPRRDRDSRWTAVQLLQQEHEHTARITIKASCRARGEASRRSTQSDSLCQNPRDKHLSAISLFMEKAVQYTGLLHTQMESSNTAETYEVCVLRGGKAFFAGFLST